MISFTYICCIFLAFISTTKNIYSPISFSLTGTLIYINSSKINIDTTRSPTMLKYIFCMFLKELAYKNINLKILLVIILLLRSYITFTIIKEDEMGKKLPIEYILYNNMPFYYILLTNVSLQVYFIEFF